MTDPIKALTSTPSFESANMSDPAEFAAWALCCFPSPNTDMGDVPVPPPVPRTLSARLWALGFKHHPEQQTLFPIPGDHPEAGHLNLPRFVPHAEYEAWRLEHSDPAAEAEKYRETAASLLGTLDPKLAKRIDNMTPEERAVALEGYRQQLPAAFQQLAALHQQQGEP